MDLPAPDRRPAPGPLLVSSSQPRRTPAPRARVLTAEEQGQDLDQPQVICSRQLRNTAARLARSVAQGKVPAKTNRCKRTKCRELNPDALVDLLLLLPAKDVCRLRAVCRRWTSLTNDPSFIAAHMLSHPGPLFVVKFQDDLRHIHVVDLSGTVIKTMEEACAGHQVLCTRLNVVCLSTEWNRCRVLNPATGGDHVLPYSAAPEHANYEDGVYISNPLTFFSLGRVASTGEYKVLRLFNQPGYRNHGLQVFEVYTINGPAAHAQWRARPSPEHFVDHITNVVVDGVVYFLALSLKREGVPPDYIMAFDLGSEEWRNLIGPISRDAETLKTYRSRGDQLALAELQGCLVLAYYHQRPYVMDLWFLTDSENGVWLKEYSIRFIQSPCYGFQIKPLLVLGDGRLVLYHSPLGLLRIYNPETNTFADVQMRLLNSVGVFTGSLLSSQKEGDMV